MERPLQSWVVTPSGRVFGSASALMFSRFSPMGRPGGRSQEAVSPFPQAPISGAQGGPTAAPQRRPLPPWCPTFTLFCLLDPPSSAARCPHLSFSLPIVRVVCLLDQLGMVHPGFTFQTFHILCPRTDVQCQHPSETFPQLTLQYC